MDFDPGSFNDFTGHRSMWKTGFPTNEFGTAGEVVNIANEQRYPTPYSQSPILPLLLLSLAVQKHSPTVKKTFKEEYDYVIVGAGSAGSAVAARLSEIPCVTVLLLEAGRPPPALNDIPGISSFFHNTDIDWQFKTTPQKHTGLGLVNRQVAWPSGKTLGGSSVLNSMEYVRGNRRNYDEWASLGAEGWSYEEVLPYFKKLEDNADPAFLKNGFHAVGGPVTASQPRFYPEKKQVAVEAVKNEGYKFVDSNAYEQVGFYDFQASIRRGQRCSTAKAYLVPSENRTNLDILPNAMVRKVLIKDKRAVGVEFDFKGKTRFVKARREVIMSAGTTNTAQLLILSGIGPLDVLKQFEIPVVADLPVGYNFRDHPASLLIYLVDNKLPKFDDEIRSEKNIREYIERKTGPLTSAEGYQLMSFLSNYDNPSKIPDHTVYITDFSQIFPQQLNFRPEMYAKVFVPLTNQSTLSCAAQLLRPRSVGTVTISSKNPYDQPVIEPNYLADFQDVEDLVQGLKVCERIFKNPIMRKINARPSVKFPGCEEFEGDFYLRCVVRYYILTTNHQVGTAKMGDPKDPNTVVDSKLRVKGIKGLRVVDASIMPTIPWGNTNIITIMIAEKASDIIKSTIKCEADIYPIWESLN